MVGYSVAMTVTLYIETSGAHCSLALAHGEQIFALDRHLERAHNQHLLPMLDELFEQANLRPAQTDLLAFGCGPGSFTGVRIAAAATQAIALVAEAPVVAVPSTLAMAITAADRHGQHTLLCSVKSRGQAYYLAVYETASSAVDVRQIQPDQLWDATPSWLVGLEDRAIGIGVRPDWLAPDMVSVWDDDVSPRAAALIPWVIEQHHRGLSRPAEWALPRYVEGDSPWKKSV